MIFRCNSFSEIFSDYRAFQVYPECFRMIPERPRVFSDRFGGVKVPKSQNISKTFAEIFFLGRKVICWESFETVVAEVSDRMELILGGKRPFKVWRTPVRTYSSEASPSEAR